jgi:nucleotide-binding universal stress UspA family protein
MSLIARILYPVDFSPSCVAMAPYVKRAATLLGATVSLVHVVDPTGYNGMQLYVRPISEVVEEYLDIARARLDSFLAVEFPAAQCPRIFTTGDAATEIARIAREDRFDLIIMPTHSGMFRQMLLGSTTAKVINDADCLVMTSRHAQTIAPRPLEHRQWLCAIGLSSNSERVLRYASQAAAQARSKLSIIHAVQTGEMTLSMEESLEERVNSTAMQDASRRIADLQRLVGMEAPVRIAVGSVKDALLEAALESDADVLIIGRNHHPGSHGRMRDLTYAMVRDSPFPVLCV